jgi:hypothetical protein
VKVLTVVGRAESRGEFERLVEKALDSPWEIQNIIPLEADAEAKSFLAYVDNSSVEEEELDEWEEDVDSDEIAAKLIDNLFAAVVHDSPDDAMAFAAKEYGSQAFSYFSDPITTDEVIAHDIFMALITRGDFVMIRGRFDGNPACIYAHFAEGHGKGKGHESIMTPLAILVDEELGSRIELPVKSSYEE